MDTLDSPARRLIIVGGFAAVIAVTPSIAVFAGPNPMSDTPMAACPYGEHEDLFTDICVPELVPNAVADPRRSEAELEQDIYHTPGISEPHASGTTVP